MLKPRRAISIKLRKPVFIHVHLGVKKYLIALKSAMPFIRKDVFAKEIGLSM